MLVRALSGGGSGQVASGEQWTPPSGWNGKITCGFKPKVVEVFMKINNVANNYSVCQYDAESDPDKYIRYLPAGDTKTTPNLGDTGQTGGILSIDTDGFTLCFGSLTYDKFLRVYWVAAE